MPDNVFKLQTIIDEKDKIEKAARLHWLHWLIVLLSLVLTLVAWYTTKLQVEEKIYSQFEREVNQVTALISERLKKYEDALWGGVALMNAQENDVDYEYWRNYSESLNIESKYKGINGIGVIYYLKNGEELNNLIYKERELRPDFKVHPDHENKEYWPIVYIEPMDTNLRAVGLDMAHEENRFTAAKKARDTGTAEITGPIILVQDKMKTPGFLFYAPFYSSKNLNTLDERRKNFVGMVYAPFIMKKLMDGTLEEQNRRVGISISDDSVTLYNEHSNNFSDFDPNPILKKKMDIEIYGRQWSFDIWTTKSFRKDVNSSKPTIILIGGILIDTLLLVFFIFLTRSNKRAINFSNRLTKKYKEKNEKLEEAESFQNRVLDNIPDLIFVKDENYKIVSANKAFIEMYPVEMRDKIIGYTTLEEFDPNEAEEFLKNDKDALETGYNETIEHIHFPNGELGTLFTKKIGFKNNNGEKFVLGVAHNITDIKKAEEQLVNSNLELERFAYVAAHDMQEPARIIKNFSEILEKDKLEQLDKQGQIYLKECIRSASHMQELINDLLEYSKTSEDIGDLKNVDMQKCFETALQNLNFLIEEKLPVIKSGNLPVSQGNEMRCIRLFQNLISNAIKYQPPQQQAKITVSAKEMGEFYQFQIKDNGIGIKKDYQEQIFEPFKKLHHHTEYKGTGIGLSICRKIVESMQGKLWVESEEGKGSTFYFTLKKEKDKA